MTAIIETNGIDFSQPGTDKPANLANSAVLRMLEEEERNRRGYPSQKKVVWPPVPETNGYHSPQAQQAYGAQPNYQQQHSPQPQQQQHSPQQYSPQPQQQQYSPQQQQYSPQQQQYSPQQQQYSPQQQQQYPPQQQSPQPQYEYQPPQRQFEPPPATITLRQSTPIHQKPSPVFASQPAAASYKGGVNMRGDQKWPPQQIREAVAAENEARRQLAKGPACRPRRVNKDYSSFFAQHRLNNNYPGYRAPPGTQHYEDYSGRSSY